MPVESIRGVVEAAIQSASNATGVDFGFLMGTAKRESGYDPHAKAPTSSAAGLFQFVEQTWLGALKQHGAKYGYARYADLIQKGADGRFHVTGAEARQTVMNLRLDPHAASLMAGELAADHASYLRGRVGRDPTPGELYIAHFLGPNGSAKLIETAHSSPSANAAALFPDAARANHNIFYRDGRASSVAEVYARLTSGAVAGPSRPEPAAPTPVQDDSAFIQYASARRSDRVRQQAAMVDLVLRGSQPVDDVGAAMGVSSTSRATSAMFSTEMLRMLSDANARARNGG